jgi:hypothetical protein
MTFASSIARILTVVFVTGVASRLDLAAQTSLVAKAGDVGVRADDAEQRASFQIKVSIKTQPGQPTTYDRTRILLETVPQFSLEIVEVRDETRGLTSKYNGTDINLTNLFGPKTGLTDHITVSAIVRLSRQPGEAVVRRTIFLRNVLPELLQKAETQGTVRIAVQLDTPVRPEASLNEQGIETQRKAIRDSQDLLISALEGAEFKVIRRFEFVPGFVLDVGPKALSLLDRLPQVFTVNEEHSVGIRPMAPQ